MARLYFAYGANTNLDAMSMRCPNAEPIGVVRLHGHRLVFRGVADVEPHAGSTVAGALWEITEACEASLDIFEGYPRLYDKAEFSLEYEGARRNVMLYYMVGRGGYAPPFASYEDTLREGYDEFGMSHRQIDAAIAHARASAKTEKHRLKRHRRGQIMLPNWSAQA